MFRPVLLALSVILGSSSFIVAQSPVAEESLVFAEQDGIVAVEAEHFVRQTATDTRAFYLTHQDRTPDVGADGDPNHVGGASCGAYLEVLPDTRRTHGDKLIKGTNFSPEPGKMAIVSYRVHFQTPGRYYVWVRAYSSGPEDNGLHVGIDGQWPESGQRLQWCEGKNQWRWESKQRTESEHCGEPHKIYLDIPSTGLHTIEFSMREDGFEFDKWLMTTDRDFKRPTDEGPDSVIHAGEQPPTFTAVAAPTMDGNTKANPTTGSPTKPVSDAPLQTPRQSDGDGNVTVHGETKVWHKVTLDLHGPYAHEKDNAPNPFTDYRMNATFTHAGDSIEYTVPGYFAADGNAVNTSAESGMVWRVHFVPDRPGRWDYKISFAKGQHVALDADASAEPLPDFDGRSGTIEIAASDKTGRDLRAHGRLRYVGKHYLQFAGSGKYFLKAGADAPETLLGYVDFDNTIAGNPKKAPLKTWASHVQDWNPGDPTWKDGQGKGLIGAINYLSGKGCNAFSFLTYNAGGDGDNVWPFIHRDDKLHYDCSKLDQWGTVFDHGTARGMYLHFKMQETENDDHDKGTKRGGGRVNESLDGGDLGVQRKLYCRELIARFGHNLALNWNLGEENTQTTEQVKAMIDYIAQLDAYDHNIVIHTFPNQQDQVYDPLLGDRSGLTGVSLQNSSLETTHSDTVRWVEKSARAGKPWIVAFDESGSAAHAQCPDLGYNGFDGHDRTGKMVYTEHKVRKQTLWATLMGGGAGCEYYFGYQFDQNDIVCEDWRSRDRSWDYCRIAIGFFHDHSIPFWEMTNADALVGNPDHEPATFCFAKPDELYLVYIPDGDETKLDLTGVAGTLNVRWFNPRVGGNLQSGSVDQVSGGGRVSLGSPPEDAGEDWLAVIRK
ncbi:DUF5060 domain-containing protein [Neorhodopirellula pilleata]|uniref:DUF5060 domain-containing protein n=1 Tax=Neorhodopirellula pilleata TaxID=2714738 RepID=A0A5C6A174_9BACT|nr:DUF5060 domain-containing protein [Neorhodopirellula pilleata]TWT93574.1 hypothetical protein Pla100_40920 [Neorhodopirellula pilleata]